MTLKILLCDDREVERGKTQGLIEDTLGNAEHHVTAWDNTELSDALRTLFGIVKSRLDENASSAVATCTFDDYDLVIIDNNLSALELFETRLTAESIAGYLRAFSRVPYVVSLNKNPYVDFDLRFLMGDYSTRADVAIRTEHLQNDWLWHRKDNGSPDEFRPWYWPCLSQVSSSRQQQIEYVKEHLDDPILPTLGFDARAAAGLSRHTEGALSPEVGPETGADASKDPLKVTFRDFFRHSNRSLPLYDERETLLQNGEDDIISRVVAAEWDVLMRRDIVGAQAVLVDLPHLLARMPFLLGPGAKSLDSWNNCLLSDAPPFGLDKDIYDRVLSPARFQHDLWSQRPAFWWTTLEDNPELRRLFYESKGEWGDFVFCEDTSKFAPRRSKGGQKVYEFAAEFESEWDRRFIQKIDGYNYSPNSRFAL
ncbi:hypothetical protein [Pelagibacterium halotolerans]|uniref:hypothetical protein n=1 Tax=Pelagibacterium halotolerans TaxID=531813 RepID=UPI00384E621F